MNHSFGENQKLDDAKAGGSEGEGVQAFNLNSDISTFFITRLTLLIIIDQLFLVLAI